MQPISDVALRMQLLALEQSLVRRARDLALFLVFDRPQRVDDRPGLARAFFAQRCLSDTQLEQIISAFRSIGCYVELFEGELPWLAALADGRIEAVTRDLKVVYNGIEGGITVDGFEPGRKALVPVVSDAYGLISTNSNAYACALGRHKFHYFTVLRALGIRTPRVWHYRPLHGWVRMSPPRGIKVIAKSTYESWSVGVTEESVYVVDESSNIRVSTIAREIGQPVTVQEFISGREIGVPVLSLPDHVVTPPVEVSLLKAPDDNDAVMTIDDNLRHELISFRRYEGSEDVLAQLRITALDAFEALELQSFARIDFRVDDAGRAWVIDVGVSPGLGVDSSAFRSIYHLGVDHPTFLRIVVAATLATRGLLS